MARKKSKLDDSPATPPEPPPAKANARGSESARLARLPRVIVEDSGPTELAESLGLDQFHDPDDAGLSLEELGQTYAALMGQGADPYEATAAIEGDAVPEAVAAEEESAPSDDEPLEVISGDDEVAAEVTPLTILESMLFVGHPLGEPLTSEHIAGLMRGVRPAEIDELVQELNDAYERDGSVYHIASRGAGYRLELRAEWGPIRDRFYGRVKEARLSQSAVDVLAVVAYQQPVTAEEVERLRGKPSGGVLSQLVRRDLLRVDRPAPKTPPQYTTTPRFLDLFGLDDLADLPQSLEGERGL
jgi:segregation and condensation protein B